MIKHDNLRRLYEAANRDRKPQRFFEDLDMAFRERQVRPADFSVRKLIENFIPDGRELIDSWNPSQGGAGYAMPEGPRYWGQVGTGLQLLETSSNVGMGAFAHISGQIVFNAIMDAFMMEDAVFSGVVPTVQTSFNGERIPGITRMGDEAAVVDEGQPYPHAGVTEDYIDTPQTLKRGLKIGITKEAAFFDRTGILLQRCAEVGEFLAVNKEKRVIDCVIDENVTTHRYNWRGNVIATYGDSSGTHSWDNLVASNALVDWTDVDNAEQNLAAITDPNTGEPVVVTPTDLIVTRDLLYTARRVVMATEIQVVTPGYATSGNATLTTTRNPIQNYRILTSLLLKARMATDSSWFIGNVSKAFKYMQNWPMTVVQAPANSQDEFDRDIILQHKASERGAASTHEPRYMNKSTA